MIIGNIKPRQKRTPIVIPPPRGSKIDPLRRSRLKHTIIQPFRMLFEKLIK
jgi:hypothetical protein